ncbi:MAG: hypothetical protein MHM6MM_004528 [Cercozoa sp. M6MM]
MQQPQFQPMQQEVVQFVNPTFAQQYVAPPQITYEIKGRPAFAFVDFMLPEGAKVLAEKGAMLWMDGNVTIETWCFGGCLESYYRTCAGESFCQNQFQGPGRIAFGFDEPGDILPFGVMQDQGWVVTSGGFVCGTEQVVVTTKMSSCLSCLCSGEGLFLTHVKLAEEHAGQCGTFFGGGYGSLERHEVPEGSTFFVDTGLFFAGPDDTKIELAFLGGLKEWCCSGEGIVMKFQGPTVIYTQSRDPAIFAKWSSPSAPNQQQKDNNSGGVSVEL